MLADRHYMREGRGRLRWSVSAILMLSLVVIFAMQCINVVHLRTPAEDWLALTHDGMRRGFVWQLLTFQFLHGGLLHLLGNLLGLFFIGRVVEQSLGSQRYLLVYLGAGVMGGVLQGALMLAFPRYFAPMMYGASAGVSGLFAVFALLDRETEVRWNFLIPVRAMTLLWIYTGMSVFFTLVPADHVAHAAHLGGILGGWLFIRLGWHRDFQPLPWEGGWERLRASFRRKTTRRVQRSAPSKPDVADIPVEELVPDFISSEVDPILDKISAKGIHSLSERERKTLEAARKRMSRR